MLNHAGNSYIIAQKQLCHLPDTVMSQTGDGYITLSRICSVCLSGSRSNDTNDTVAKQSKRRSWILKQNEESKSSVSHFIWLCFYLKMSHYIYNMVSRATVPENTSSATQRPGALCQPLHSASSDITAKAFASPRG